MKLIQSANRVHYMKLNQQRINPATIRMIIPFSKWLTVKKHNCTCGYSAGNCCTSLITLYLNPLINLNKIFMYDHLLQLFNLQGYILLDLQGPPRSRTQYRMRKRHLGWLNLTLKSQAKSVIPPYHKNNGKWYMISHIAYEWEVPALYNVPMEFQLDNWLVFLKYNRPCVLDLLFGHFKWY